MDSRAIANQLITTLGETLTIPGLKLADGTDTCVLSFDDDLVLNIEYDDSTTRLVFSIYIGEIPPSGAEPLLREILAANFFWQHTGGATLALEKATGGLVLVYALGINEFESTTLEIVIENLLNAAEEWRQKISDPAPEKGDTPGLPPHPGSAVPIFG